MWFWGCCYFILELFLFLFTRYIIFAFSAFDRPRQIFIIKLTNHNELTFDKIYKLNGQVNICVRTRLFLCYLYAVDTCYIYNLTQIRAHTNNGEGEFQNRGNIHLFIKGHSLQNYSSVITKICWIKPLPCGKNEKSALVCFKKK